jgi:hypothetical protein
MSGLDPTGADYAPLQPITLKDDLTFAAAPADTSLRFCMDSREVVAIDLSTGRVTIAEGFTLDEAAKQFWACVEACWPGAVRPDPQPASGEEGKA